MAQVRDLLADVKKIDAIEASVTQLQTDVTNFDALPSQVNQTGKYLTTNGVDASWGTVTVPTAVSQLTNDSQYQTLSQVSAAVAGLVDSAPSTLDTLNELATALGNDPNFATTITNSIAGKANLSGGTFTGNVTVNGLFEVKDPGNYYNGHMRVGAVGQGYPYVNIGMDENDADNPGMVVGWYIKALGDIITNRIRLGGVYGQTGQIIAAPNTYEAQWTTIKTVNGTSILGAGDIIISAYADSKVQTYLTANNYVNTTALNTAISTKANQSTTYTKTEVDNSLATKVSKAGDSLGGGTFTKGANSTINGNLSFDNGTTDTPGLHFYYGNSTNFGIDVALNKLRVVKNLDESGGAEIVNIDANGSLFTAGQLYSATAVRVGGAVASAGNIGLDLYSGDDTNSYSRIRHFIGTTGSNASTIHFFPSAWSNGSFEGNSGGAVNISGTNGVTFGGWNAPDASISSTRMRMNGDRYTLYGPNSGWQRYFQVGGTTRVNSDYASIYTTDGNLHLDARVGNGSYINWYSGGAVNIGNGSGGYGTLVYGSLSQGSDYRIKENVSDIDDEILDAFYSILFKQYNAYGADEISYGVIAHELQDLLNSFVRGVKDQLHENGTPLLQSVDYQQIFVLSCRAVQKQKQTIDALTNTVNDLLARVAALEAK